MKKNRRSLAEMPKQELEALRRRKVKDLARIEFRQNLPATAFLAGGAILVGLIVAFHKGEMAIGMAAVGLGVAIIGIVLLLSRSYLKKLQQRPLHVGRVAEVIEAREERGKRAVLTQVVLEVDIRGRTIQAEETLYGRRAPEPGEAALLAYNNADGSLLLIAADSTL